MRLVSQMPPIPTVAVTLRSPTGRSLVSARPLTRHLHGPAHVERCPEQRITMLGQDETTGVTMEERNVQIPLQGTDAAAEEDWFRSSFSPARVKLPASATS